MGIVEDILNAKHASKPTFIEFAEDVLEIFATKYKLDLTTSIDYRSKDKGFWKDDTVIQEEFDIRQAILSYTAEYFCHSAFQQNSDGMNDELDSIADELRDIYHQRDHSMKQWIELGMDPACINDNDSMEGPSKHDREQIRTVLDASIQKACALHNIKVPGATPGRSAA